MSGPLLYDFGGLMTAPGLLARNPASCVAVSNFRFPMPGVMRKRPGFALGAQTAGTNETFTSLMSSPQLNSRLIAAGGGGAAWALYYGSPAVAWAVLTDIGTTSSTSPRQARMAVCGGSHYVCQTNVRRLESNFTAHRSAGMPRGISPFTYSMNAAIYSVLGGAGGFLANGSNVAYRITFHQKTDTGVELGGPPTSRLVIRNIAGTSGFGGAANNVTLRIPVPFDLDSTTTLVTTSYYWRLWRSRTMVTDTADDEMYEVGEAFFTATDITNGYAVFTDATPDAFLLGQPRLNTNSVNFPAIEAGILNGQTNADEPPPRCQDIAEFAGCMWYASPLTRASFSLTLLSAGFAAGNTITINGTVLTAVAGVPVAAGDFTIVAGLATLSLNIEATARNIVDAFNRTTGRAAITASYVSQGTQQPGQMFFEGHINLNTWSLSSATAGGLFRPNIVASTTVQQNSNTNVVYFSKPGRPDAVPVVNALVIGPSSAVVYRIVAFRERLLCFTSAGLYQVDGTFYGNFTPTLVDASARIFEQESVVVQDDHLYAWCYNGIVEISDGGTEIVSTPIEPTLQAVVSGIGGLGTGTIYGDAFSVADKQNHIVYFFYSVGSATPYAANWLEFDSRGRKWSTGTTVDATGRSCAAVQQSSGLLVLGNAATNPSSPSGVAKCFIARAAMNGTTDYNDDTVGGTPTAIVSSATFQFQVPDTDSRQHWQQLLAQFENGEQSFYPRPSSIRLLWESDTSTSAELTVALTSPLVRVETPQLLRRSTRERVRLRHILAEHCGLLSLNQSMREDPARFPK